MLHSLPYCERQEVGDEDLWEWFHQEIRLSNFHWSTIPLKQFIIFFIIIISSLCKSAPYLVCCPQVFCKLRYKVFNLSCDFTLPLNWGVTQIYKWELLAVCHYPAKSSDHNHCDSVDMFLICHVTSCEHIFKMLCEFTNGVTTSPILVVIGVVQVGRDI